MSDYELTDSESDYEENEKILLNNYRRKQQDSPVESEEELFSVGAEDDDDDDEDEDDIEMAESDVEERENDGIPSDKAWGKRKSTFYSTDYVDPDYEGYNEKDMQLAEMEGEEAQKLQMRLAKELDDDAFTLDFSLNAIDEETSGKVVKADSTKLTAEEKVQYLRKESPELFNLMEDFQSKIKIYKKYLKPVIAKYKLGKLPNSSGMDFVNTFSELILNYCVNIYMFILLKASEEPVNNHPVLKRLSQYRQLLTKLEPIFEESVKQQLKDILEEKEIQVQEVVKDEKKKKKLKLLDKLLPPKPILKKKEKIEGNVEAESKNKVHFEEPEELNEELEETRIEEPEKRGITYQIAKNKGLTPHRKKEQRNPRVKHRNAFRKAKIRRKGAVREVRNEIKRYGGEISGIKATVTKSIKIKS